MFKDLDDALFNLLDDPVKVEPTLAPLLSELSAAEIDFLTPDKTLVLQLPTALNLFLYEVKENRTLRDPAPIVERQGNSFVRRKPPLRVDCKYLVTAHSKKSGQDQVKEEHRLLAQGLLWLSRFPTLPPDYLQGTLANQPFPVPMLVAQIDDETNTGQFWSALGVPPRSAFHLIVTLALDPQVRQEGPLVTTRTTQTSGEAWVQIGGRLLTVPTTAARAQATLLSTSNNQATVTSVVDAANFRPGDIVFLQHATDTSKTERATVASIAGATFTLQENLINSSYPANSTIRIADLIPGQRAIRLADIMKLQAGGTLTLTQGATIDGQVIESIDSVSNRIVLARGLIQMFSMASTDPVVHAAQGIASAVVDVVDMGLRTTSEADGRYYFVRVPAGTHTLRAVAVGFQPQTQTLVVPGLPGDYEITLTSL